MPSLPPPACPLHQQPTRRALVALALTLPLLHLPACATNALTRTGPVEMSIVDRESGQALPLYRKDGRSYVAGQPAARYSIRLANQTAGRVLVVLSVDGVNVISGQTAAFGQTGYVLDPWRSYDITGWRKSDTAVAAFEFAALRDSYAARTGRPANVGVIGMAVFLEKPAPVAPLPSAPVAGVTSNVPEPAAKSRAEADSRPDRETADAALARAPQSARLGTAHGQREWSVSTRTEFERLSHNPQAVFEIAYDSWQNLVAAGVIPNPLAQARPRAFPGGAERFVPDPPAR